MKSDFLEKMRAGFSDSPMRLVKAPALIHGGGYS